MEDLQAQAEELLGNVPAADSVPAVVELVAQVAKDEAAEKLKVLLERVDSLPDAPKQVAAVLYGLSQQFELACNEGPAVARHVAAVLKDAAYARIAAMKAQVT